MPVYLNCIHRLRPAKTPAATAAANEPDRTSGQACTDLLSSESKPQFQCAIHRYTCKNCSMTSSLCSRHCSCLIFQACLYGTCPRGSGHCPLAAWHCPRRGPGAWRRPPWSRSPWLVRLRTWKTCLAFDCNLENLETLGNLLRGSSRFHRMGLFLPCGSGPGPKQRECQKKSVNSSQNSYYVCSRSTRKAGEEFGR